MLNIHKTLSPDNKPNVVRLDQQLTFNTNTIFNDHSVFLVLLYLGYQKIFTENTPTNANVSANYVFHMANKLQNYKQIVLQ